jgi:hypothetical protein
LIVLKVARAGSATPLQAQPRLYTKTPRADGLVTEERELIADFDYETISRLDLP